MTETRPCDMACACLLVSAAPALAQGLCEYEVTIIQGPWCGEVFEYPTTLATGLGDNGCIVGFYNACDIGPATPFIWSEETGVVTLDMPANVSRAWASDVNDAGIVVGTMDVEGVGFRGFVYDDGEVTELGTVTGLGWSGASAINNQGVVVGERSITDKVFPSNAFIWSEKEGFLDLGVLNGPESSAVDINDYNEVVGWTGLLAATDHGFLYQDGNLTIFDAIPGGYTSAAGAISDNGIIAGVGLVESRKDDQPVALGYVLQNGQVSVIEPLPGYDTSGAVDGVNSFGYATGFSRRLDNPNDRRAFVWIDGKTFDLNDLVVDDQGDDILISEGEGINDAGQIVAEGIGPTGAAAFLLTPIGVPSGDLNIDCSVGTLDLMLLLGSWGSCEECPADLDDSGIVDHTDLLILLGNWG